MRDAAPAEHGQVLPCGDALDRGHSLRAGVSLGVVAAASPRAGVSLGVVAAASPRAVAAVILTAAREEDHPGRVSARLRQRKAADGAKESVRDLGQDAGPVPGIGVAALRAPVLEVAQDGERAGHDAVTAAA